MKLEEMARGGLLVAGLAGLTAGALLGVTAGYLLARQNPETLRRFSERATRAAARGLEEATLLAAQTRERVGDMWADAREHARTSTDAADFEPHEDIPEAKQSKPAPESGQNAAPRRRVRKTGV